MREGTDVTLIAFGKLVGYNLKVAEELDKEGISCEVRSLPPVAVTFRLLGLLGLSDSVLPTIKFVTCVISLTEAECEFCSCR